MAAKATGAIVATKNKIVSVKAETLPAGWSSSVDEASGDTYYVSPAGEAQWSQPEHPLPAGWARVESPDGAYFANAATGESSWQRPLVAATTAATTAVAGPVSGGDDAAVFVPRLVARAERGPLAAARHSAGTDDELPAGWRADVDETSGDRYFTPVKGGQATWTFPTEPAI